MSVGLCLLALISGCGGGGTDASKVRIGLLLDDNLPTVSASSQRAAQLAADAVNAAGGILVGGAAKQVQLVPLSVSGTASVNLAVAKLAAQGITTFVGPASSGNALPAAAAATDHGMVMITPWSTNPLTTLDGAGAWRRGVFRACFTDDRQAPALGRFVRQTLGAATACIVTGPAAVLKGQADGFTTEFTALGGTITSRITLQSSNLISDYDAAVATVIMAHPAAVFVPVYAADAAKFVRRYVALGGTAPLLGSDAWDDPQALLTEAGVTTSPVYASAHFSAETTAPAGAAFVQAYRARYAADPTDVAALTADSVNLLARAIGAAGVVDAGAVTDALAATSGYDGITGTITWKDGSGTPVNKPIIVLENRSGKMHFLTSVLP